MMRYSCLAACLALAALPFSARAEHARIDLKLIHIDSNTGADGDSVSAAADQEPPQGGFNERPILKVKAGEPLALQFVFTNTYPHGVIKDATVRYYVAPEEKPGRKSKADLKNGTVTDGQFTLNLKPKCRVGARAVFSIKEPGFYVLRVETVNTDSDHEHFAAIDIEVEKAP
ncbi:MAG TPA: hypothetical protein DDY78_08245 [Planctomycetales bacterium]|nr:hypothetical protein [Planctomycetales bacterium]